MAPSRPFYQRPNLIPQCCILFQAIELTAYKKTIFDYVESRMGFIAPNLSIIVGASTAAKIMGMYHRVHFILAATKSCFVKFIQLHIIFQVLNVQQVLKYVKSTPLM